MHIGLIAKAHPPALTFSYKTAISIVNSAIQTVQDGIGLGIRIQKPRTAFEFEIHQTIILMQFVMLISSFVISSVLLGELAWKRLEL